MPCLGGCCCCGGGGGGGGTRGPGAIGRSFSWVDVPPQGSFPLSMLLSSMVLCGHLRPMRINSSERGRTNSSSERIIFFFLLFGFQNSVTKPAFVSWFFLSLSFVRPKCFLLLAFRIPEFRDKIISEIAPIFLASLSVIVSEFAPSSLCYAPALRQMNHHHHHRS